MGKKIWNARSRQVLLKCLALFLASLFLTWLIEYRYFLNNSEDAWGFVYHRPLVFCYSALIVYFLVLLIYGIFRRVFLTIGVATATVLLIGYINIAKFNFRGTPLLPEDFELGSQAGTLTKFVDTGEIIRLIIAMILCVALGVLLDNLTAKWLKVRDIKSNVWWRRYRLISRVAIIVVAVLGFMVTTDFVRHHSNDREINVAPLNTKFIDWNQTKNYHDNGFVLGFLYNLNQVDLLPPGGYTEEKISEIKSELMDAKQSADKTRAALSDADYNVVFILNESFYDPSILSSEIYAIERADEITSNLHKLQQQTPSGTMYSIDYGGGTANIEYEAVTGLTNNWVNTVPYTNLLAKKKQVPSMASFAKENGYNTAVIHPFSGGMYKREVVLPKLGFSDLIFEEDFSHREKFGKSEYIDDGEVYSELIDWLQNHDEKQFVSVITMQNHAPYDAGLYDDVPYTVSAGPKAAELDPDEKSSIETYLTTLHQSDEYLGEFVEKLAAMKEKTVVLFYGDHSPGVFPQVIENTDKSISDTARQTPYFIYANFPLDDESTDIAASLPLDDESTDIAASLPRTTPNCMGNTLLNLLNVTKPLHYYLLDEVCMEQPILTDVYFGANAPFMSTALSEYEILTYDIIAGKQYYNN